MVHEDYEYEVQKGGGFLMNQVPGVVSLLEPRHHSEVIKIDRLVFIPATM
jgi:hypothetical protein